MAETTIQWVRNTDGTPGWTFNPWTGCTRVSAACDHCYAEAFSKRNTATFGQWGNHPRKRTSAAYWRAPLKWDRACAEQGIRGRVFCASMADVFDNHGSITSGWHGDLWALIRRTPNLDWLLLTKRPQNIVKMLPESYGMPAWGEGWPNVWLGTTVENQTEADRRIPHLLSVPARVRFLSMEPLLGPVDLTRLTPTGHSGWIDALGGLEHIGPAVISDGPTVDWVIVGGESGPNARPMDLAWCRAIRDQCRAAGVPFFMKQLSQADVGKDYGTFETFPEDLQIREMPR